MPRKLSSVGLKMAPNCRGENFFSRRIFINPSCVLYGAALHLGPVGGRPAYCCRRRLASCAPLRRTQVREALDFEADHSRRGACCCHSVGRLFLLNWRSSRHCVFLLYCITAKNKLDLIQTRLVYEFRYRYVKGRAIQKQRTEQRISRNR